MKISTLKSQIEQRLSHLNDDDEVIAVVWIRSQDETDVSNSLADDIRELSNDEWRRCVQLFEDAIDASTVFDSFWDAWNDAQVSSIKD